MFGLFLEEHAKDHIEELVKQAACHSPLPGMLEPYLYSTLMVTVPVGEQKYKTIVLRRKVVAETGHDIANEEQGAIRYFSNLLFFVLSAADSIEEDIYADDEETYDVPVGKSMIYINRDRLGFARLYSNGSDIIIDITKDES